jgi:hypothetical protein
VQRIDTFGSLHQKKIKRSSEEPSQNLPKRPRFKNGKRTGLADGELPTSWTQLGCLSQPPLSPGPTARLSHRLSDPVQTAESRPATARPTISSPTGDPHGTHLHHRISHFHPASRVLTASWGQHGGPTSSVTQNATHAWRLR